MEKIKEEITEIGIRRNLRTKLLGSEIKVFKTIDSTSTFLKENICENGELVVSSHQTKGRGRRGREFVSSENRGIYFSFVLNTDAEASKISNVTICVAGRGAGRPIRAGRHGEVGGVGSKGLAGRLSRLLEV